MAIKQRPDSPTNNFCTLNPLDATSTITFDKGNLNCIHSQNVWGNVRGSMGFNSGRYYWEAKQTVASSTFFGFSDDFYIYTNDSNASNSNCDLLTSWKNNGGLNTDISITVSWGGGGYSTTDILMICVDYDLGYVWLGKNGSWLLSGDPDNNSNPVHTFSNSTKEKIYPYIALSDGGGIYVHFGQDPTFGGNASPSTTYPGARGIGAFYYQPPTGAKALCTANLLEMTPTVNDDVPKDYFKTVLWTGQTTGGDMTWNGTTGTVTVGFQPDLVWGKNRDFGNYNELTDSVRGATRSIYSNETSEEGVNSEKLKSFDSNGFSIGNAPGYNRSGDKHVAWCWKAGGTPSGGFTGTEAMVDGVETTCSSLATSAGASITPTAMSVNTNAGFSIVKWTGNGAALVDNTYQSIPTGLSGQLAFAIQKRTDTTGNWHTYHKNCSVSHTYWSAHTYLNNTFVEQNGSGYDSQVFKYTHSNGLCEFQNGDYNNVSSGEYISYFFEEVEGYSKFGSYIGNGSADGPFVYCGFRPAWIMIKNISISENFTIRDSARTPYNPNQLALYSNLTNGDDVACPEIDFLSNGFKLRANQANLNQSNGTGYNYIFMAFAEQPFNYANAR